jgi:hypothetical protein
MYRKTGTVNFIGTMLFDDEPERECWHEAGHAIVGHHLGMKIMATGFSWVSGEDSEPNPSTWIETFDGFEKDILATQYSAGMAAETIKLGEHDFLACKSDRRGFETLGCASPFEHYATKAIEILTEKDAALVRIYERLMLERTSPSNEPFVDTDGTKRQVHLDREDFKLLL